MFMGISQVAALAPSDGKSRDIPPPTPVRFPTCAPKSEEPPLFPKGDGSLVALLQAIHRPTDIRLSHFEALGLHVISDAPAEDLIPDTSYLPPVEEWNAIPVDDLLEANERTRKPLSNGNLSPGVQTYRERQKELLIDNTSAFRTIRRIPPPTGEPAARLGNTYEFFKNLEFFSGYWLDTSVPESTYLDPSSVEKDKDGPPLHMRTHVRTGTGSQIPPDFRQHLLSSFIKLVAYDFGCNASFPRCEPRLHLTPPPRPSSPNSQPVTSSPSYFNSSVTFIYRSPTDRASARAGVVEGPVATLSARASTVFATEAEEQLDLAREVVAILLTAQQRARENKNEIRFGEGKWWTEKPRWGGGPGGPIGKEGDKDDFSLAGAGGNEKLGDEMSAKGMLMGTAAKLAAESRRQIGGINGPSPSKRSKKGLAGSNMAIYENYRKMNPPGPTWDRKARYSAIGKAKVEGKDGYDDIFLVSALNHHISILRARVPDRLLEALDGGDVEQWGRLMLWRSKWFDLYLANERVEAMGIVWGMIAWMMRKTEGVDDAKDISEGNTAEKMDLS